MFILWKSFEFPLDLFPSLSLHFFLQFEKILFLFNKIIFSFSSELYIILFFMLKIIFLINLIAFSLLIAILNDVIFSIWRALFTNPSERAKTNCAHAILSRTESGHSR